MKRHKKKEGEEKKQKERKKSKYGLKMPCRMKKNVNKWIVSDETKFNLNYPDGYLNSWHGLRSNPKQCFGRQIEGKSVIVWKPFSHQGLWDSNQILKYMDFE